MSGWGISVEWDSETKIAKVLHNSGLAWEMHDVELKMSRDIAEDELLDGTIVRRLTDRRLITFDGQIAETGRK